MLSLFLSQNPNPNLDKRAWIYESRNAVIDVEDVQPTEIWTDNSQRAPGSKQSSDSEWNAISQG